MRAIAIAPGDRVVEAGPSQLAPGEHGFTTLASPEATPTADHQQSPHREQHVRPAITQRSAGQCLSRFTTKPQRTTREKLNTKPSMNPAYPCDP